jgi:hypothetical protein
MRDRRARRERRGTPRHSLNARSTRAPGQPRRIKATRAPTRAAARQADASADAAAAHQADAALDREPVYLTVACGMLIFGCLVLLAGFDQPLTLVVLAAALSGVVMFIYSGLLIAINRRFLPAPLRIRGARLVALVWAVGLFGVLSVVVIIDEFGQLS